MDPAQNDLAARMEAFLTDPAARRDPYPFFRHIRAEDPVHCAADGTWWVTSYEGCLSLMRDRRWSHENPDVANMLQGAGRARTMISRMLLFRDAPDHTRLRKLLGRIFMRMVAEEKRPEFREHVDQVVHAAAKRGRVDFREEVARQIPMYMICDVLGLPQARYEDLINWANQYASMLAVEIPEAVERQADDGFAQFVDYVAPLLEERRRHPRNDLLSEWVAAEECGELAPDEIAGYALFTLTGGQMTTTLLMANALYTLKRHPDQWERLVAAPDELKETATDEVLRFESSSRALVPRWASQDMELLGKTVPKGAMIIGIEAAANRDPKYFDDPERFDIGRANNAHLAFGGGPHVCPGQFVARVETQELMASLAEHYPDTTIEGAPVWLDDWIVRGLDSLPVRLIPRSHTRKTAA